MSAASNTGGFTHSVPGCDTPIGVAQTSISAKTHISACKPLILSRE